MYRLIYAPYRAYRPLKLGPFLLRIPYTVREYVLFRDNEEITVLYAQRVKLDLKRSIRKEVNHEYPRVVN